MNSIATEKGSLDKSHSCINTNDDEGSLGDSVGEGSNFSSGHDLTVGELEPCIRLSAVSTEPASDPLCPSLTGLAPLAHACARSLSLQNKTKHSKILMMMLQPPFTKHLLCMPGAVLFPLKPLEPGAPRSRDRQEVRAAVLGEFALRARCVSQYCVRNNPKLSADFSNTHLSLTHESVGQVQLRWAWLPAPGFTLPILLSQDPACSPNRFVEKVLPVAKDRNSKMAKKRCTMPPIRPRL